MWTYYLSPIELMVSLEFHLHETKCWGGFLAVFSCGAHYLLDIFSEKLVFSDEDDDPTTTDRE